MPLVDLEFTPDVYPWSDEIQLLNFDASDGHLLLKIRYNMTDYKVESNEVAFYRLNTGVYEGSNLDFSIEFYTTKVVYGKYSAEWSRYGVADNYQQVLAYHKDFIDQPFDFVVEIWPMRKSEQPPEGGWRWSKWGEYIGEQNSRAEYLANEPEIEEVVCYNIYRLQDK